MIVVVLDTNMVIEFHRESERLERISRCVVDFLMGLFRLSGSDRVVVVVCYSRTKRELRRESIKLFGERIKDRLCGDLRVVRGLRLKSLSKIVDPNVYEDVRRMVLCDRGLLRVLRGVVKGAKGVDLARGNVVREVDEDVHLFLKALYMSKGARLVKIVTGDHKARDNLLDLVDSLKEKCGRDFGIEVCYVNIR